MAFLPVEGIRGMIGIPGHVRKPRADTDQTPAFVQVQAADLLEAGACGLGAGVDGQHPQHGVPASGLQHRRCQYGDVIVSGLEFRAEGVDDQPAVLDAGRAHFDHPGRVGADRPCCRRDRNCDEGGGQQPASSLPPARDRSECAHGAAGAVQRRICPSLSKRSRRAA